MEAIILDYLMGPMCNHKCPYKREIEGYLETLTKFHLDPHVAPLIRMFSLKLFEMSQR